MHHPAPVAITLNPRTRAALVWRGAVGLVWAAAAAGLAAWLAAWLQAPQWQLSLALSVGGVVGVGCVVCTGYEGYGRRLGWGRAKPVGHAELTLAWTGEAWQCHGQAIGPPVVRWDGGCWMLVKLSGLPRREVARWWVVCAASAGPAWHPFRAAVYAHEGTDGPPSLETMALGPHLR